MTGLIGALRAPPSLPRPPATVVNGCGRSAVTRINLPYLQVVTAKGQRYAYYRRDGQRLPITAADGRVVPYSDPPTAAWLAAYQRIHASFDRPRADGAAAGSLKALIEKYIASPDFAGLSAKTKTDYRRYLDLLAEQFGRLPVKTMPRAFVLELRDRYAATPRKANYLLQVLRLLLNYAVDRGWRADNPALRPKQLKTGEGHRPWEEAEIAAFRKRWPADTVERVAFELMLNTGQRGGDVIKMQRNHLRDGWLKVRQSKTNARVDIPSAADLRNVLTPWLRGHDAAVVLVTETGRPFTADHFRHTMRAAYEAAALPRDCTSHGLRYTAATRLAELGCDWETVAAVTGHETAEMARKYVEKRRKTRIAVGKVDAATSGL